MLIQELGGASAALLVELALGLGSAEPRAVGLSLPAGCFALNALPEPFEINDFPRHKHPRQNKSRVNATGSGTCEW